MDIALMEQYMQVLFRFRKHGLDLPRVADVNMIEFFVMGSLASDLMCEDKSISFTDIQNHIHVSKAAISQMFASLEKKGYVVRETDRVNRRKITVSLTEKGLSVLVTIKEKFDEMLEKTLTRFGEKKARQLITLLNEMSDIADEVKNELTASD